MVMKQQQPNPLRNMTPDQMKRLVLDIFTQKYNIKPPKGKKTK